MYKFKIFNKNNTSKYKAALCLLIFFLVTSFYTHKKQKILIIGDSISIGYTPFVHEYFKQRATIIHNEGNAQHTGTGLLNIQNWLGNESWDVIQFNWGLWDLCYRHPDSKEQGNRDKINGKIEFTIKEYESNLDSLVFILKKKTKAKLIFVTTTYVPKNEAGRFENDPQKYNEVAKKIMKKHGIPVNDIHKPSILIHKTFGEGSDNVHYKKEGYEKLSKLIIAFLEPMIN